MKPDRTTVPLPVSASNTTTVPEGSLLMVTGGPTITLRPGVYASPYGVITVTPTTVPAAAGPATPLANQPGMVFANLLRGGTNPGGYPQPSVVGVTGTAGTTSATTTVAADATPTAGTAPAAQPGTAVQVFDATGNPVGFAVRNQAIGAVQFVSQAGAVLGTLQSNPMTGGVTVVGANGAVLGNLGINPASNALTLVAATPAPATTGQDVEVFDLDDHPAGFAVIDQATGSVKLVSPAGSVLGTVQADQTAGSLVVVGTSGAVLGQLDLNPATGAVTLLTGSSSPAPGARSPSPGGGTASAVSTSAPAATTPEARQVSLVAADPVAGLTPGA